MEFFALKFQFWISKHRDEDQEIHSVTNTQHAAGKVRVVPANVEAVATEVYIPQMIQVYFPQGQYLGYRFLSPIFYYFLLHFRAIVSAKIKKLLSCEYVKKCPCETFIFSMNQDNVTFHYIISFELKTTNIA